MRPVVVKPLDATDNPEEEAGLEEDQMSIPSDIENGIDPAEDNPDDYEDIEDDATKSGRKAKVVDKEESKTRKIQPNAVSHMNFRRLNIKNKNSKGRGRGGGFGRRRR